MKERKRSKGWYKNKAWKVFSEWVRRKDSDCNGYAVCVTCGAKNHWKKMQAGHYVDGRNNSVLFDERIVWPQCMPCNVFKRGNKIKYSAFLSKKFGYSIHQLNALDNMKFETKKTGIADYQDIIDKYTDALVGVELKGKDL